jgi:hypothetical protein
MGMYRVAGSQVTIAPNKTALNLIGSATCRPRIGEFHISTTGVPGTEAPVSARGQRTTADGTGTAVIAQPTDSADPASIATAKSNYSAEPTYKADANLFDWFFNPRTIVQWNAYDPRAEILIPANAGEGFAVQTISVGGATGNLAAEFGFYDK